MKIKISPTTINENAKMAHAKRGTLGFGNDKLQIHFLNKLRELTEKLDQLNKLLTKE